MLIIRYDQEASTIGYWPTLSDFLGDAIINCGTRIFVNEVSKRAPVYFYIFSEETKVWQWSFLNATHGAELPYVLIQDKLYDSKLTPEEKQLGAKMRLYWANMARSGDPNSTSQASAR